jgi:ubiquinone/menaquinone biosynthesis C-methylase UbiE
MPTDYTQISEFWTKNPCSGGNKGFPFWMWKGKRVLEIGTGTGVDAMRFVNAKALYNGIDLSGEGARLANLRLNGLGTIKQGNGEFLDFPDQYFDLIYSFGVIHHTLRPFRVVDEMFRVLKPGGFIFVMLYNKLSWRYFEIQVLRRILWWLNYPKFDEIKKTIPNPTPDEWISINTDEIGCPLSRVYSKKEALDLLSNFTITKTWTEEWGWFRMIIGKK